MLRRGRELRRVFGESTGDAEPVEKGLDEGLVRLFVDRAVALLEKVAQHHVLIDGHEGQETEFLIGDGDLQRARDVAAEDPAGRAVDGDRPRIMAHRSPEDLDQGGFPGAVGSQQGDDLAPVNVEGSVAQGLHDSDDLLMPFICSMTHAPLPFHDNPVRAGNRLIRKNPHGPRPCGLFDGFS